MKRIPRIGSFGALVVIIVGLTSAIVTSPAHAGAVRPLAGFTTNVLPANDDGSTGLVPIGFTVNFFGNSYSQLYVNNNGNVTFDSALWTYTPFDLTSTGHVIIAPFFGDVDTRGAGSALVTYGNDVVNGRPAFGVDWAGVGVGYYGSHTDKLNIFQLILIDRSDISPGGFDIEFNYDQIQWETGDASGGSGGLGGYSARVGYSNGTGNPTTFFELPGSAMNGAFLDSNLSSGLIYNRLNSPENGRYVFFVRGGSPCPPPPPPACTEQDPCYALRQAEICPTGATLSQDAITVEPSTGSFCPGDQIGVSHVREGTFTETVADEDIVCHGDCVSSCTEYCVAIPLSSCWQVCLRRCSNGACIQWETRCTIDGTQTQCANNCFNQCSASFEPAAALSSFVSPCGFPIDEAIDVRSSDGTCTGALISTQNLTGAGTAAANVSLPLVPGLYDLCVGTRLVQTITVDPCAQPACAVRLPSNAWSLLQGAGETFPVTLATSDTAGGTYSVSLVRFEDDAHTMTMPLPPFVSAPAEVTAPNGGSASFDLMATDPQPVGSQVRWPGLMIRAQGPATCEATIDIEITCTADADCDDGNPCTIDRCAPTDRQADLQGCVLTPEVNGTPCGDGDGCTQDDTCQAGVCTGGDPVTCTALDQCHDAGACDPATGLCSNPQKPDGTGCDDGTACTRTDTCQAGACAGADPVVCTAPDQCHEAICDPATGLCSNPPRPDGTTCDDGNACTQTDSCQAGVCTGATVVCAPLDQCHDAGVCDPASGLCSNPVKPDGSACDDGNMCTMGDSCVGGVCGGNSTCGNSALEASCGEQCDDGNTINGDGCSSTCQIENRPPDCGRAAASRDEIWPPNHQFEAVTVQGVTDPNGDPLTITVTGIRQDEALKGNGDGNTCPDGAGVGTSTAMLRAERAGTPKVPGDGRVYQVSFKASDGKGGECSGTVRVCVPHDQRPGHRCVDQGPLVNSTGPCS